MSLSTVKLKRLQGDRDIVVCKGGVADVQLKLNKILALHDMNILSTSVGGERGDIICCIVERIRRPKNATE
jgi:hypothetical protein